MIIEVVDCVCGYGLKVDDELKLVLNSKENALLIKEILQKDSLCNKGDYVYKIYDHIEYIKKIHM